MRRVLLKSENNAVIEEVDDPKPAPGEVMLKVAYSGICGSDIHAFQGKHPFVPLPATPGHEFSGTIAAIGEGVSGFNIGDRVSCEPNLVCGECYNCKIGRYNICESLRVMGCQGEGADADYFIAPAEKTVKIPDNLSLKHAALIEPLAVGVHAVRRAGDLFGKNIVIIGAGMIGLSTLVCVAKSGAKRIIVTDLSDERLQMAKKLGATQVINAGKENAVENILEEKPYEGIDVVFEAVGIEKSIRDAMEIIRKGGKIIVIGVFGNETTVKMAWVQDREMELIGTLMYTMRDFMDAADILASDPELGDMFITSVFPLEDVRDAFESAMDTKNNLKVLFEVNPE